MNLLELPSDARDGLHGPAFCSINARACGRPERPGIALVDWLRDSQQVHTVHRGCDTGHCGSCAVMLDGVPVKSCTVLAGEVQGQCVATADALAGQGSQVAAALLREMRKPGVFQCGFCASAFVLAATALLERDPRPDAQGVRQAFDGLLCRCTGYQRIVEAVLNAAARLRESPPANGPSVHHPTTLAEAVSACLATPGARVLGGGQQVAREARGLEGSDSWVSLRRVDELRRIALREDRILSIGAGCTHRELSDSPLLAAHLPALAKLAGSVGDALMRNRGTVGGALFDIVPGSSYPAALIALDACIVTTDREIEAAAWCDAREGRPWLAPGEIVREIRFALPDQALYRIFRPVPARLGLVALFAVRRNGRLRLGACGQAPAAYLATEAGRWLESGTGDPHWDCPSFNDDRADACYRDAMATVLLRRMRADLDPCSIAST